MPGEEAGDDMLAGAQAVSGRMDPGGGPGDGFSTPDRRGFLIGGSAVLLTAPALAQGSAAPDGGAAMPTARASWTLRPRYRVDHILIEKQARRMTLSKDNAPVLTFRVALGRGYGPKSAEGDGRTPEGLYYVEAFKPDSQFYRALKISYPNEQDRQRAARLGVSPGDLIMIHGLDSNIEAQWQANHWMFNWTNGCVAVTNAEIDVLWESVALGTPVEIRA